MSDEQNNLYWQARHQIAALFGNKNTLVVPRAFIAWTGDLNAAALLNQTLYLSAQEDDGWFPKSYPQWFVFCGLSEYQVRRAFKKIKDLNLGLETKRRKVDGAPTLHYRIDPIQFWQAFQTFLGSVFQDGNLSFFSIQESQETSGSMEPEETPGSSIDLDQDDSEDSRGVPDFSDPKRDYYFEVIGHCVFGLPWRPKTIDKDTRGRINRGRAALRETRPDVAAKNLYLAYLWTKAEKPLGEGMNASSDGPKIIAMIGRWDEAGCPDVRELVVQPASPTPSQVQAHASAQADDDDEIVFPEILVDHAGKPIERTNDDNRDGRTDAE